MNMELTYNELKQDILNDSAATHIQEILKEDHYNSQPDEVKALLLRIANIYIEGREKKKSEVTVRLIFHGEHTSDEIREAAGQMLSLCKPATVGEKVLFLKGYVVEGWAMKKIFARRDNKPFLAEIYVAGNAPREKRKAALKEILGSCQPVAQNNELFFLQEFQILKDWRYGRTGNNIWC